MNFWYKIKEDIKQGNVIKYPQCPNCRHFLVPMLYGEPDETFEEFLETNGVEYELGGCCICGDDRDYAFYCRNCDSGYTENLKLVNLISCMIEGDIFSEECRKYEIMREHYTKYYEEYDEGYDEEALKNTLYDNREFICDVLCPGLYKRVKITSTNGEQTEGIMYHLSTNYENIEIIKVILGIEIGPYETEYKEIFFKDILSVEVIDDENKS